MLEGLEKEKVGLNNFGKEYIVKDPRNGTQTSPLVNLFLNGLQIAPPKYVLMTKRKWEKWRQTADTSFTKWRRRTSPALKDSERIYLTTTFGKCQCHKRQRKSEGLLQIRGD